jgi:hypothetical protein
MNLPHCPVRRCSNMRLASQGTILMRYQKLSMERQTTISPGDMGRYTSHERSCKGLLFDGPPHFALNMSILEL